MKIIEFFFYIFCLAFFFNMYLDSENPETEKECFCYQFYNKHAARKNRVVQTTCDSSIFELRDRFEVFKQRVACN